MNILTALQEVFPTGSQASNILKIVEDHGIENCTVEVNNASGKGDNYIGCLHRIHLKGSNRDLYLILKCAKKSEILAEFLPMNVMFKREIFMYDSVLKRFTDFQRSKGITKPDQGFFHYAEMYGSSPEEDDEHLILEDLNEKKFVMLDRQKTLNVQHCELILQQLARYHACCFAFKDQAFEEYSQWTKNLPDFTMKAWYLENGDKTKTELMRKVNRLCREKSLTTLDPEKDQDVVRKVSEFYETIDYEYFQYTCMDKMEKYTVIAHADCWNNNFMFKYDGNEKTPVDIRFLDWQISYINSPVADLAHFTYFCTDEELRETHFDKLMDFYFENLRSHLIALGSDPETVFPYKGFKRSLRKYFRYGVLMALSTMHVICCDPDEMPDYDNMQMSDCDSMEKIEENNPFGKTEKSKKRYKDRMGGILRHAARKGFLD